jgi:TolA-binding protein
MDRQHRRDLKHDKFVDELGTLSSRARQNQRLLMTLTAVLVLGSVLVYGFFFYRSNREQKAQDALSLAIGTIDSPLQTAGQQAAPGAKFKTEAERTAAAEKEFKDVQTHYPGSDATDVANLYLARIEASRGDAKGAEGRLQSFVSEHPNNVLVGAVRYSLYQLRIENGEAAKVATELQTEIAKADSALPADTMLVLLAHAYDAQGANDKSKEAYRRIITEFPDSPYALEAQRRAGPAA